MQEIFFGKDGKIRSGWRALTYLFSFMLIASALIFVCLIVLSQLEFGESTAGYLTLTVPFAISALLAILLGWGYGRLFESLPFAELGISFSTGAARNFLIGSVVGVAAIATAVLIAVTAGGLTLTLNETSGTSAIAETLASTLVIFLIGALSEEALFRGYLLQTFVRSDLAWFGIAFTSLLFASAHGSNPETTSLAFVNTAVAGVWFSIAYLKTRDLWFPLGIHLAWNWLQGPVFGISVSGLSGFAADPVMRAIDHGPASLTGGAYGLEGGYACTIAIAISGAVISFLPSSLIAKRLVS